jgi:hypothetical protein
MARSTLPNQAASRERRDCATIAFGRYWRGVGEPRRWTLSAL